MDLANTRRTATTTTGCAVGDRHLPFLERLSSLALAVLAEVLLGFVIWIWLGTISTPAIKISHQLLASVHFVSEKQIPSAGRVTQQTEQNRFKAVKRFHLPEVRLPSTDALMGVLGQIPRPSISGILQQLPPVLRGAWKGSAGQALWVDVPVPGAGGLPASPFSVTQLHYDCGRTFTTGHSGSVWVEGRVNRQGHVTSSLILRYSTNQAPAVETARMVRKWRFAPLKLDDHLTWFRIVVDILWGWHPHQSLGRRHSLYTGNRITRCRPMQYFPHAWFNGVMPQWLLYRLRGHHPLAIMLATGRNPIPGVARAVRLVLLRLQGRLREGSKP
jgi:hypothetical protein